MMEKVFNTTGNCVPTKHYMVNIEEKLKKIKRMIDRAYYFTINRGRQYGKTTTLFQLETFLADDYTVISLTFERMGQSSFSSEAVFCQKFLEIIVDALGETGYLWKNQDVDDFERLSKHITAQCQNKRIVLMIDEVDKASNFQVFLGFLNMLRSKFIDRNNSRGATFHSVILVGVYDIKNIKFKMVQEGSHQLTPNEVEQNSPWNIAERFNVDMSFSPEEISTMLIDYENDYQVGMNVATVATEIHNYTNGYPVLVSTLCRYMDEGLSQNFSNAGVEEAVRRLLRETDNELFKSLAQNVEKNEHVRKLLYDVLILGERRSFFTDNSVVDLTYRYGYIREVNERIKISNRIFEMRLGNYFISKTENGSDQKVNGGVIYEITKNNTFNMPLCLERFKLHWAEISSGKDAKLLERECRLFFLTYLKPILNGVGFYFIESALTDDRRMDVVVIYNQQRFVLELKIWKGELYNEQGVEQLLGYMDKLDEETGYLLTFDFRKKPERIKPTWRKESGKKVFEVRV